MEGVGGGNFAPGQIFSSDLGQVPIVSGTPAHSTSIVGMANVADGARQTSDAADSDPRNTLASITYSALHNGHAPDKALAHIANAIQQEFGGIFAAVFFSGTSKSTQPLPGTPVFCGEKDATKASAKWGKALRQIAGDSLSKNRFASGVIKSGDDTLMVVANPVVVDREVVGVFGLVGDSSASRDLAQTINVVGGAVAHWWKTESQKPLDAERTPNPESVASPTRSERTPSNALMESTGNDLSSQGPSSFLTELMTKPCLDTATQAVAHHLCKEFGFEKVFVGRGDRGGASRLLAISNTAKFSPKSPLTTAAEEVFSEAIIRDELAVANIRKGGEAVTSGSRELSRLSNQPIVISGPLRGATGSWGAWVGVGKTIPDERVAASMAAIISSAGPCLQLFDRARGGRIANAFGSFFKGLKTKKGLLSLLVLTSLAMLVPMPYRVKCDSELQPVTRRFIPVPYDGVLQEVFVEPGDEITAGQVLARMDGREIEWELAAVQADYGQAAKQHDSDLASRDTAAAQVASLEMDRLRVQMELLKDRASNLEVKSPIDGVIIGGDPKKKEGARLAQGDSLFEAGPLSNMVAEIYVPDDEVSRVEVGQKVSLRLDAYPSDKWKGQLLRISPSAEVHASENVFVAEFEIENPKHTLRPGMRGRSRITTKLRPLGWNLFHKAWEQLVYGWGW